jgi:hypothetical protein
MVKVWVRTAALVAALALAAACGGSSSSADSGTLQQDAAAAADSGPFMCAPIGGNTVDPCGSNSDCSSDNCCIVTGAPMGCCCPPGADAGR